jgi:hypothetical protein
MRRTGKPRISNYPKTWMMRRSPGSPRQAKYSAASHIRQKIAEEIGPSRIRAELLRPRGRRSLLSFFS